MIFCKACEVELFVSITNFCYLCHGSQWRIPAGGGCTFFFGRD